MKDVNIILFDDDVEDLSTKSSRREARRRENVAWKFGKRSSWNDEDPNPKHTEYYKIQLPSIFSEWRDLSASMSQDLLVSFRLCNRNPFVHEALKIMMTKMFHQMRGRFKSVKGTVIDEVVVSVPWCTGAFQINTDGATLAKDESFSELHHILCREVKLGHIVRQELVSMIPAIFLDVRSHHTALDMCAAPGSKTEQLLSAFHFNRSTGECPTGLLVANDADPKRMCTLRERYKACTVPNLVFTCATAATLERALLGRGGDTSSSVMRFDRIICDVPCTGDGTFRKSPHLWRLFRPRFGMEVHPLQLDIAKSGLRLLKQGGRLVYSTCSLNPIEDEAVVTALLRYAWREGMNLQLADPSCIMTTNGDSEQIPLMSSRLPGMKYRRGISSWHCDEESFLAGETDANEREQSRSRLPPILPSMRPPPPDDDALLAALRLDRCMRIVPHDMNTGGFFVAVLELLDGTPPTVESSVAADIPGEETERADKRSLRAFVELGYNPKVATNVDVSGLPQKSRTGKASVGKNSVTSQKQLKMTRTWRSDCAAIEYQPLSNSDVPAEDLLLACEAVGCTVRHLPQELSISIGKAYPVLGKKSKSSMTHQTASRKDRREQTERRDTGANQFVLVSSKVSRALNTWGSNGDIIVQAGVTVADVIMQGHHLDEVGFVCLNPSGAMSLMHALDARGIEISVQSMRSLVNILRQERLCTSERTNERDSVQDLSTLAAGDAARLCSIPAGSYALLRSRRKCEQEEEELRDGEKNEETNRMVVTGEGRKRHLSRAERKASKKKCRKDVAEYTGPSIDHCSNHSQPRTEKNSMMGEVLLVVQNISKYPDSCVIAAVCPNELLESYEDALKATISL